MYVAMIISFLCRTTTTICMYIVRSLRSSMCIEQLCLSFFIMCPTAAGSVGKLLSGWRFSTAQFLLLYCGARAAPSRSSYTRLYCGMSPATSSHELRARSSLHCSAVVSGFASKEALSFSIYIPGRVCCLAPSYSVTCAHAQVKQAMANTRDTRTPFQHWLQCGGRRSSNNDGMRATELLQCTLQQSVAPKAEEGDSDPVSTLTLNVRYTE